MENIGFNIHYHESKILEEGNALVSNFLREASEIIETEINEDGGIGGKQIKITFEHVVKGEEGLKKALNSIRNTPNTLFTHGNSKNFIDGLDLDSLILFARGKSKDVESHPNIFEISHADHNTKSMTIKCLLEEINTDARVIFIHDGKRMSVKENDFTSNHKGKVKSVNFSDFQTEPEIEKPNFICLM